MTSPPFIRLDASSFDPWRIQAVEHALADHPLLQIPSLLALAKRQEAAGRIRMHSDDVKPDTSFNDAPIEHPNQKSAIETLSDVENARAWMSLLNVQTDEMYRRLIDEVLDGVRPIVEAKDPGMCYRAGWIFITSPRTVTPFHMDTEHNFILQIQGKKRIYVWDHRDRDVVPERGQELFHSYHSRELVRFREEFRAKAIAFDVEPGQGAYMPSTSPHLVENGDNASITMSFTFYTRSTRRRNLLYRGTNHLRRLGLNPAPVGQSAIRDMILFRSMQGYVGAKELVLRALGRPSYPASAPYAFHLAS